MVIFQRWSLHSFSISRCFVEGNDGLLPSPGAKKRLVMEEKRDEARAKLEGATPTQRGGRVFSMDFCLLLPPFLRYLRSAFDWMFRFM